MLPSVDEIEMTGVYSAPEIARLRKWDIFPLAENAAASAGIPVLWLLGVMDTESGFSATLTSGKGAMGLMQILPSTFKSIASKLGLKKANAYRPEDAIAVGTDYLASALRRYDGNFCNASASYLVGPGNVTKERDWSATVAKRNYVAHVLWSSSRMATAIMAAEQGLELGKIPTRAPKTFKADPPGIRGFCSSLNLQDLSDWADGKMSHHVDHSEEQDPKNAHRPRRHRTNFGGLAVAAVALGAGVAVFSRSARRSGKDALTQRGK